MEDAAKRKSRTALKRELQDVINELRNLPCVFWACPGPDRPIEDGCTCRLCYQVKELRRIRDEI